MRHVIALGLLLSACGGAAADEVEPAATTAGGGEAGTADVSPSERSDPPSAEPTPAEDAPAEGALPPSVLPAQGEAAFGVYVARVDAPSTATDWMARLAARGVEHAGSGELGCDRGAAEALSLPPETIVVSVAFATRADADLFAAALGEPVLGVAPFTAYCRD